MGGVEWSVGGVGWGSDGFGIMIEGVGRWFGTRSGRVGRFLLACFAYLSFCHWSPVGLAEIRKRWHFVESGHLCFCFCVLHEEERALLEETFFEFFRETWCREEASYS